jgi:hypothetical protein
VPDLATLNLTAESIHGHLDHPTVGVPYARQGWAGNSASFPASPSWRSGPGRKGKHLLDGLACNAKLPCDVGLGISRFNQAKHDFTTFECQPPSLLRVLDSLRSNLLEAGKGVLIMRGDSLRHESSMTTACCRVNYPLSSDFHGSQSARSRISCQLR